MACVRYLAQHVAERDRGKVNEAIGSCAGLYLMMGAAALVVGASAERRVPRCLRHARPRCSARRGSRSASWCCTVSAGFIGLLPEGIMFAHHDFVLRNADSRSAASSCASASRSACSRSTRRSCCWRWSSSSASSSTSARRWLLIRRRYPGDPHQRCATSTGGWCGRFFSFSLYVLLLNAGARLSFETDALVIGAFLGVGSIPFYAVANSLIVYLMEFIIAIAAVVSPMATKLQHRRQPGRAAGDLPEMVEGRAVAEPHGRPLPDRARPAFHRLVDRSVVRATRGPRAADPDGVQPAVPAGPRRRACRC